MTAAVEAETGDGVDPLCSEFWETEENKTARRLPYCILLY